MIRKSKIPQEYWCVAYLIMFNTPRERYAPYDSLADLLNDGRMQLQKGDYIIRVTKNRRYFLRCRVNAERLPEKMFPSIEYDPENPNTRLIYRR